MKNKRLIHFALLAIIFVGLVYFVFQLLFSFSRIAPNASLNLAIKANKENKPKEALELAENAKKSNALKDWAKIIEGQALEKEGKNEEALRVYKEVNMSSAASVDARLAIAKLTQLQNQETSGTISLNELEAEIRRIRRKNLLGEILFLKANYAYQNKDFALAYTMYKQVRQNYLNTEVAKKAKEETEKLKALNLPEINNISLAEQLEEATLLLKEGDTINALEKVQDIKEQAAKDSAAYYQTVLTEEQILRQTGRKIEADNILLTISSSGNLGTADKALLKIIKNAWNKNENKQALKFVESFEQRFNTSEIFDSVLYIKARILEEENKIPEAKEAYEELSQKTSNIKEKIKALRQVAWIFIKKNNYFDAASYFSKILDALANDEEKEEIKKATSEKEIQEEKIHALYWLAYSLSKLSETEQIRINKDKNQALLELIELDPYGYYGMLGKKLLGEELSIEIKTKQNEELFKECTSLVPEALNDTLTQLNEVKLKNFIEYEINWAFPESSLTTKQEIKSFITRLTLLNNNLLLFQGVSAGQELLNMKNLNPEALDIKLQCLPILVELSFPFAYKDLYKIASQEQKVPLSLIYAISRTESYFDTQAKSNKDAIGLMQLLQETAKQEGLKANEDLFEPKINIMLGAKHIARLLNFYAFEPVYAIAAYNAGSLAVDRWRERNPNLEIEKWIELISYSETRNYVKKVLFTQAMYQGRES